MKLQVTDQILISKLQKRIVEWLGGLAGNLAGVESGLRVTHVNECSESRITYGVECETRALTAFSRPDKGEITPSDTPVERDQIDIWAVSGEVVNEFINYKQVIALPQTIRALPCRSCGGSGAINCPACAGQKAVYCPKCHGSGKEICSVCKGAKNVPCDECGMSGQVFDSLSGKLDTCPRCKGKKESPCPSCGGKGGQPCAACNGRQRVPCEACAAAGKTPCEACGRTGKVIIGFEIVATYKPFKETIELKRSDVPPIVIEKLGDAVAWSKEPLTDADKARLPREVVDAAERLKAKIVLPLSSRAVFEELYLEKKIYHQVAFSIVNSPQTVWVAGPKLAVFSDVNPVLAMYAGMLEELRSEIAADRVKDASELLARLEAVPSIAEEVGKLRRKLRVKLLWPAIVGSIIAALAVSAGGTLLIMKALAGSLNVKMVVYQAVAANLLFAIFIGFALFSVAGKFVYGLAKRVILSFFVTITFLGLLYGGAILMRFNPARDIDEQQMKAEYAAYFPFGRRTLATDVDIKFLGRLINKYKLAGIDLSQQRQDMKWLEDKIIQDKASLAATEKMRQKIEDIDNGKAQKKQARRSAASHRAKRRSSKIKIK